MTPVEGVTPVSVLVAEPQRLFAEALKVALADDSSLVVCGALPDSPGQVMAAVAVCAPDVVVIDSELAVREGLVAQIHSSAPATKVVVVSWLDQIGNVDQALAGGAVGYLPKSCDVGVLCEAIRQAHAGQSPVCGAWLAQLLGDVQQQRAAATAAAQRLAGLSSRELEVLRRLAVGCPTREIARQLDVTPPTVQTHIRNLKHKTGARTHLDAVRMLLSEGTTDHPDLPSEPE